MTMKMVLMGALAGIVTTSSAFADPGAQPTAGFYVAQVYTTAATPTNTCSTDGTTVGGQFTGSFYYPGPAASGAFFEQIVATASSGSVFVQRYHGKTPAAGVTSWTGSVNTGVAGQTLLTSVPFTATLTFFDESSFEEDLSFTKAGCTRTYRQVFARVS